LTFNRPLLKMQGQAFPKSFKLKKHVDRLTVLDGVVIATGWCERGTPQIVVDRQILEPQMCHRISRPDVEGVLGTAAGQKHGFKISAMARDLHDYSQLAVRFSDDSILRVDPSPQDMHSQEVLDRFLREVKRAPEGSSLIELGSRARSGNSYRHLFPTISQYTGVDLVDGENVDLVADLHQLSKSTQSRYDFAFSISVFEHLLMPWVVAVELNKVLATGGLAFIQSHPTWTLHDEPWDFFRFSKEAWHGLFNAFTGFQLLDSTYGLEASVVPIAADSGALQGIDMQRTYLVSACLIRKISEPEVDWSCDPSGIYQMNYEY
jgi:hypothetical protein